MLMWLYLPVVFLAFAYTNKYIFYWKSLTLAYTVISKILSECTHSPNVCSSPLVIYYFNIWYTIRFYVCHIILQMQNH